MKYICHVIIVMLIVLFIVSVNVMITTTKKTVIVMMERPLRGYFDDRGGLLTLKGWRKNQDRRSRKLAAKRKRQRAKTEKKRIIREEFLRNKRMADEAKRKQIANDSDCSCRECSRVRSLERK